ncbi:hypothetical protein [Parasitella parasitica]|uniref:Peroxisomal membrane protein PEX14 n=1 Tax=Parasitella parasitica TaxID=35722 RepID=A0A0B7N9H4_9FUNG|nr:hypothetical protein [Parasitella parasitica]
MREELIKSAVSFLSTANVKTAEKDKKTEFLRGKGLTDHEIEEAFKRVEPLLDQTTSNIPRIPPRITYGPIQVVYYPSASILRMTNRQLLHSVLSMGLGSFVITAACVSIIKSFMSNIFNAIAAYQSDRYQQHTHLLKRMQTTLNHYSATPTDLKMAQERLDSSLVCLTQFAQQLKQEGEQPYKSLRSTIRRFTNSLANNPVISNSNLHNQSSYQSGFASAYRDRYQVDANHSLTVQNIKSEIRRIKGSLLNRKNFPVVAATPTSALTERGFVPPPPTVEQNHFAYHPRIGRSSFRNEKSTANTVQEEFS